MWMANQVGQDGFLLPGEGQVQQRGDAQAGDLVPVEFFGEHRRDASTIRSPRWLYLAPRLLLQRIADEARKRFRAACERPRRAADEEVLEGEVLRKLFDQVR